MLYRLLNRINHPADLHRLSSEELVELAEEIRHLIISTVERTGGHLGANLGVVELTIALHSVLSSPRDRIIWDVGHQCYAHKILTGRFHQFATLRQWHGISGFPRPSESEHDHFGAGHSSTAISAAAGMAIARDLKGEDYSVVAVVGDGALTGGMAFEALNHIGSLGKDIVVILNDNEMSIANNVGALSDYLSRLRLDPKLYRARGKLSSLISKIPAIGSPMSRLTHSVKEALKSMLPGQLFEELGFTYSGPFDGHNINQLRKAIRDGIARRGPVLIHVHTQKGKGYGPAERNPTKFHGVGPAAVPVPDKTVTFSEVFGATLLELGKRDESIVAVTAAMKDGTGLGEFAQAFPSRFFDVGIAEQHALTLSAGMAASGLKPVAAIYSTFLQRGYDQIIHDICLQNLPVVIAVDRAGVVGDDGPTHHGVFDLSFLRHVPGLTLLAPSTGQELADMLAWALGSSGPVAIRYPRARTAAPSGIYSANYDPTRSVELRTGRDCVIFAVGPLVYEALAAAEMLNPQIDCSVVDVRSIKPLDSATILRLARLTGNVVTVEDNVLAGGFGGGVLELLTSEPGVAVSRIGYPDAFVPQGPIERLWEEYGLSATGIAAAVRELVSGDIAVAAAKGD
jgi:1-deoxy-D-xylulose-5-phosphate synthase